MLNDLCPVKIEIENRFKYLTFSRHISPEKKINKIIKKSYHLYTMPL